MSINKSQSDPQTNNLWHKFYRLYLKVWRVLLSLVLIVSAAGIYFFFFVGTETVKASWWNDQWLYRKALVLDHAKVAGDLTDFPVLVSLTDTDFIGKAQDDGGDFVFTLQNGEVLKYEIESYASSSGALVAWVRMPELSDSNDRTIYMYYGNSNVKNQESPTGVWDENYNGVWHMDSAESATDSTANGRTGTVNSATATSSGKIASALVFEEAVGGGTDIVAVTVATSTTSNLTNQSYQRKTWHDGTRFWTAFRDDGENRMEFWYSTDGSTWTENTSARISYDTYDFSVEADSEYAYIAYTLSSNSNIRQASSTSSYPGNNFSWGGAKALTGASSYTNPYAQKDTNNLIWVSTSYAYCPFECVGNVTSYTSASANSLSSFTSSYAMIDDSSLQRPSVIVPLAGGKMYSTWVNNDSSLSGNYYNSGWGASYVNIASGNSSYMQMVSSPADDEAYLVYVNSAGNTMFQKYSAGGNWTGTTTLSGNTANSYPTISIDRANNNKLYAFWINSNDIYMKTADSPYTTWSATTTLYDTGTNINLSSSEEAVDGYINLIWTEGSSAPYNVKFYGVNTNLEHGMTEWKYPSTCANINAGTEWSNPERATSTDNYYASISTTVFMGNCDLTCSNFGFTTDDIPEGASVTGITAAFRRYGSNIDETYFKLNSTYTKSESTAWGVAWETINRGGPADMWTSSYTGEQIRDSGFALGVSGLSTVSGGDGYVDSMALRVSYNSGISSSGSVTPGDTDSFQTISFWINPASTTEKIINLNSTAYVEVSDGTINAQGFSSPTVYVDGQQTTSLSTGWHYVTVTASTAVDATSTEFGKIGEEYFTGVLDEVRLSGVGRSSSWIETEYNNQSDPASFFVVQAEEKGPGPVGSWSFDEGSGASTYDKSGQKNDGVITGATWKDEDECVSGKCLYFDGSGDKVTIPDIDL